jgi:S1-C subfamily serine protease
MKQTRLLTVWIALIVATSAAAQQPSWDHTLERISSGVVSIRVDSTRAFDTDRNQSAQATGFVVDAKRGLILTNRHVVTPGPVRAQAIFLNQEEVDLVPVYRDPVHDFGFFHYDPSQLKFIHPAELKLVPEAAQIGRDIRVIGNDAGEQLSILAGTIARLDRQAPNYGRGNYNDFNTFYMQAASGTSGGSSGSPVVDIEGRVLALNAGANTRAASSFFLPLDRVRVALNLIREGKPVPRGTLETEFVHKPYAELRRLGLPEAVEAKMRKIDPQRTGLLTVEQVIPGSPADSALAPGDILVGVDGEPISQFVPLEAALDDKVGQTVQVDIVRDGQEQRQDIEVGDLHEITPDEYIEYGDGVFHNLSYQQARHFHRPVSGVYVANPGYVFGTAAIPRASLITELDGQPMNNLDDLQHVLESLPQSAEASVYFVTFDAPNTEKQRIITNDRKWFPAERCHRDDNLGVWPCEKLASSPPAQPPVPQETTFPEQGESYVRRLAPSLVLVNFDMPYSVSGVSEHYYYGTGVIADAKRGLVVVDRNTVPVAMGDVRLTFAGSLEIPGRVEYIHPLHNLAVISYDPKLVGNTPTRSAEFSDAALSPGSAVEVVGLGADHKLLSQSSQVASVGAVNFPVSRTLRFRDRNLEAVSLANGPTDFDGVLADRQGRVLALWASFAYQTGRDLTQVNMGIPSGLVSEMIEHLRDKQPLHTLDVEWRLMPLATARKLALPESWVRRYEKHNAERREVLAVSSAAAGSPAADFFRAGDILLSVDGVIVNTFREAERATEHEQVTVKVWRDGQELTKVLDTVALDGRGIGRVVSWSGALLQTPQRELSERGLDDTGVYVSYFNFGSPASRSGLYAGRRIVGVNGRSTPNIEAFIDAVSGLGDRDYVRLNTVAWNDVPEVITLELDKHYWPGYELRREGYAWHRYPLP